MSQSTVNHDRRSLLRIGRPVIFVSAFLLAAVAYSVPATPQSAHSAATLDVGWTEHATKSIPVKSRPTAGALTERPFYSQILQRELPFLLYLPPGADHGDQRYPVLYYLHGLAADYRQWPGLGVIRQADNLISEGIIPPMIIVMPNGESGYWMNHQPNGPRWRDYLITEFIPYVERTTPIDARREARAIGGLSAGGHGALQLSWNNPTLFSVAGAHSPGLRAQADAFPFFGQGEEFQRRDPMSLAGRISRADLDLWLDTGDGDPWRQRAESLHNILTQRNIPHVWKHGPGGHDGGYWSAHVREYLTFYGTSLANRRAAADLLNHVAP